MEETMSKVQRPYPRTVSLETNTTINLRLMTPADSHRIVTFARSLPEDDLLFLRTDITKAFVVMLWGQNIKAGLTVTVLAEREQEVVGYASMHHNEVTWQRHLGELRVQVGLAISLEGFRANTRGRDLRHCPRDGVTQDRRTHDTGSAGCHCHRQALRV